MYIVYQIIEGSAEGYCTCVWVGGLHNKPCVSVSVSGAVAGMTWTVPESVSFEPHTQLRSSRAMFLLKPLTPTQIKTQNRSNRFSFSFVLVADAPDLYVLACFDVKLLPEQS